MASYTIVHNVSTASNDVVRRLPIDSFTPSLWADTFTSFSLDHTADQLKYSEAIEALKQEVSKIMLHVAKGNDENQLLVFIDTLERLGIGYHFEQEIEDQLQQIFQSNNNTNEKDDDDLFITSLRFRLLRQHRHYVSCSVFDKFKVDDGDNKFKETLASDVKGLLSLYEAAHLRTHGERILDEAVNFTTHHLKRMLVLMQPSALYDQVTRALEQPFHTGVSRIEHRYYISSYEKDEESKNNNNQLLLKLAKLDFNYVQNMHKNELHELTRWWKELEFKSKLGHTRDRMVEMYMWANACHFEPQYSNIARVRCAKSFAMIGILDDTYDNYATVEEAALFTQAVERWNIDEIHRLPDYMKIIYKFVLEFYEEYEREAAEHGKLFAVPYAIETVKELCRAYYKELKWFTGVLPMPTYDEYLLSSLPSSCLYATTSAAIHATKSVTKENMEWLKMSSDAKIVTATAKMARCLNDMSSHQRESKKGQIRTGMDIYMNQHGLSRQETTDNYAKLSDDIWKDVNAGWMDECSRHVPKDVMEYSLNFARITEITYKNCQDGFTNPEAIYTEPIRAIFVEPIIVNF